MNWSVWAPEQGLQEALHTPNTDKKPFETVAGARLQGDAGVEGELRQEGERLVPAPGVDVVLELRHRVRLHLDALHRHPACQAFMQSSP